MLGFPGGSVGKESACNAADSGDSVWSTAQEDPLEKGVATHSSIFAWRILWAKDPGRGQTDSPWGFKESDTTEVTKHTGKHILILNRKINSMCCPLPLSLKYKI